MKVEKLRIEDNQLLVTLAGRESTLPDGIYVGRHGETVTVVDGEVTDVITRVDIESATLDQIKVHLTDLDGRLSEMLDESQLANVDLQEVLQNQQRTLQMMSNLSKMMHDTEMSVIRKIGG